MIVVDTSAIVASLVGRPSIPALTARLMEAGSLHAPHLLDIEFAAALRGLVLGGVITADRATDAITDFRRLPVSRYSAEPLLSEIWQLRHNLTAYDANFVALAHVLRCPLVTCDSKIADVAVQVDRY